MGECKFYRDPDGQPFCETHDRAAPKLCVDAAADLERRLEAQATSIKTYQQVCARLEEEKATLIQTIEAMQAHRKAAPHGDCACQVCYLYRRVTQLEEEKAQAECRVETWKEQCSHPHGGMTIVGECVKCRKLYPKWSVESGMRCPDCRLAQAEARGAALRAQLDAQYLAGVEWGIKHISKREDWPHSWDAGFPGFKGQALIDRGMHSPDAGRAPGNINEVLDSISDRVAIQPDTFTKAKIALDDYRLLTAEVEKLREVARAAELVAMPSPEVGIRCTVPLAYMEALRDALDKRGKEGE